MSVWRMGRFMNFNDPESTMTDNEIVNRLNQMADMVIRGEFVTGNPEWDATILREAASRLRASEGEFEIRNQMFLWP